MLVDTEDRRIEHPDIVIQFLKRQNLFFYNQDLIFSIHISTSTPKQKTSDSTVTNNANLLTKTQTNKHHHQNIFRSCFPNILLYHYYCFLFLDGSGLSKTWHTINLKVKIL